MAKGKDSRFETYYQKEDSGKVAYTSRKEFAEEIEKYLALIDDLKKSPEMDEKAISALDEIHYKLESLKFSDITPDELKKKIKQYTRVPLGDGKHIHLSAYLTSTGAPKVVKSEQEYIGEVKKMVKNTLSNLTNLIIFKEEDEHLKAFLDELKSLEGNNDYKEVKSQMEHLGMSGIIKHYNNVKLSFLKQWLAPFEAMLDKPIKKMNAKEIQSALSQVEGLKKKELDQVGLKLSTESSSDFRPYNKEMHELLNGQCTDFWGFPEYRDEFVELVKKVINRFSFKLEDHYLIFETGDKSMAYMVGFPDDVFENLKKLKEEKVGMVPHLKIFFRGEDDAFKELRREDFDNNTNYFRTLKTAVVPFLVSLSTIVGMELSEGFHDSFEMWL